ncbi:hypothetical protein [Mycobacterium avium]|uniref:DUF732 domain-containing protein n=1 Tax=Mycobacterium avium (strain 104) TaxID=243243 RepID=A0A0H2ZZJ1_MYCA1|nr:hypothetical protein [Mycobacterium avium]ABK68209.1 hypothetical protein MAV_0781 [Mycobacterium avium 104]KDP08541.1 hypothetical protein MAV101_03970 [Mycobacterium avium subsp. hominissuis 101]MCG3242541.1 hypothetical protein [Mycobacterium avium subsp. hominissuis]
MSEETETAESADETVAGASHGAGGDETEVVPPVTEVAPELAWSGCEDEAGLEPAPAAGRSWARTCGYAALIGVVPAGLLILIFGFPWYWFSPRSSAPAPSVAAPTPAPTVAALPPAGSAPPPAVRTLGPVAVPPPSTVTVTAVPPATVTVQAAPTLPPTDSSWTPEQLATSTCDVLWGGGSQADAIQFVRNKTGWDFGPAQRWTAQATSITCPGAGH